MISISVAIGREGGVPPLIALARSEAEVSNLFSSLVALSLAIRDNLIKNSSCVGYFFQDVHETAAGALWNLAFNPGNALRIVEEGGVPALVHLCSSSVSKMAQFMAALALAYMFDGRYIYIYLSLINHPKVISLRFLIYFRSEL